MAKPRRGERGVAEDIAAELRYEILSGERDPGEKLPTVEDLAQKFQTAGTSVQRALKALKEERLVEGRVGVGIYVRERTLQTIVPAEYMKPSAEGEPYAWITQAARREQQGSYRLVDVDRVRAPRRVARAFGLPEGSRVWRRSRIGLLDGEPAELATSFYTEEVAGGTPLAKKRKLPGGSPKLLAEMGLPIRGQWNEVTGRTATRTEFDLLELPSNVQVLEVMCVAWTDERRPVEITELIKPAHLYRMGYEVLAD